MRLRPIERDPTELRTVHSVTCRDDPHRIEAVIANLLHRSTDGIVKIAPGIAKRILDETKFPGQRALRPPRVAKHLERLTRQHWISSMPISFARLPDGKLLLIDGYHRVNAISVHDIATAVRILIHDVDDEAGARRLYAYFDERDSVRTTGEVLDGLGVGTDGEQPLGRPIRDAAYAALAVIDNHFEPVRSASGIANNVVDDRVEAFDEWIAEILEWQRIYRLCAPGHKLKLKRIGVTAVGLYTLKYQRDKARDFWTGIARNDGLRKYDPRATLISDFHTRRTNSGSARQSVQAPAVAWNAFFEGRELRIVKCIPDAPIVILGTPYDR